MNQTKEARINLYTRDLSIAICDTVMAFIDYGTLSRRFWLRDSLCISTFTGYSIRIQFPKFSQALHHVCLLAADCIGGFLIDNGWRASGYEFEFVILEGECHVMPDSLLYQSGNDN